MFRLFLTALIFTTIGSTSFAKKIETVEEYREYVKKTVDKKKVSLRKKCATGKKFKGKMTLLWEVNEQGSAADFSRGKDTVDSTDLFHCYEKEISKLKFEKPPLDQVVEIEYEFHF